MSQFSKESITELFEVKFFLFTFFYFYAYTNIITFFEQSIFDIDSTLTIEETTQAQIRCHSTIYIN